MIWFFKISICKKIVCIEVIGAIVSGICKVVLKVLKMVEEKKYFVLLVCIDFFGGIVVDF